MPRPIRAFTLSGAVSIQIDSLAKSDPRSKWLGCLLPDIVRRSEDEHRLTEDDYDHLYSMLPLPDHALRTPNLAALNRAVYNHCDTLAGARASRVMFTEMRLRQRAARKAVRESGTLSASRVADALLRLGLAALEGKVATRDSSGSKEANAGEGSNKLSNSGRRKNPAAGTTPGGS